MFNRVILIGNLTKDPELRYTQQGTPVATLRLAVNSKFKGNDGKEEVLFIDVVAWNKLAESCSQYLSKGRSILAEGRMVERKWEAEGRQHAKVEIVAQNIRFLGGGQGSGRAGGSGAAPEGVSDVEPF